MLKANDCDSRSSQIFGPGIIVHSRRAVFFFFFFCPDELVFPHRLSWGGPQLSWFCRNVWRKSCLVTWLMGRRVGRPGLWAPGIHSSSRLCSKVSFVWGFCCVFSPDLHWHWLFAWTSSCSSELFGHVITGNEGFFLNLICLLYLQFPTDYWGGLIAFLHGISRLLTPSICNISEPIWTLATLCFCCLWLKFKLQTNLVSFRILLCPTDISRSFY